MYRPDQSVAKMSVRPGIACKPLRSNYRLLVDEDEDTTPCAVNWVPASLIWGVSLASYGLSEFH